jgi:phosphate/sulfate permease
MLRIVGATGTASFAQGSNTIASGIASVALVVTR